MRLVSWNVNGLRAVAKKGFHQFLEEKKPDVLCLQETKCHPEQIEKELLDPLGGGSAFASAQKRGYSGVATMTRQGAQSLRPSLGDEKYDSEGRVVWSDHGVFQLYNIYFPNGAQGPHRHSYKMEFLRDLSAHLQSKVARGEPIIVVGDYNIAHREIDIYDPVKNADTSGFRPEERRWFHEFLDMGFVDTFRHVHGDVTQRYSWWAYFDFARAGNRGWRIDYICITKNLLPRLQGADIWDGVEGSDHCPVVVDLSV